MKPENKNEAVTLIEKLYIDEDGFYVADVKKEAIEGKGKTYEERLNEAIDLFHKVVFNNPAHQLKG